jgi:hypothetical protein
MTTPLVTEQKTPTPSRPPSLAAIWGCVEQSAELQRLQVADLRELVVDLVADIGDLAIVVSELRDEITALRGR